MVDKRKFDSGVICGRSFSFETPYLHDLAEELKTIDGLLKEYLCSGDELEHAETEVVRLEAMVDDLQKQNDELREEHEAEVSIMEERTKELSAQITVNAKMERGKRKAEASKDIPGYDPNYEQQIIDLQNELDAERKKAKAPDKKTVSFAMFEALRQEHSALKERYEDLQKHELSVEAGRTAAVSELNVLTRTFTAGTVALPDGFTEAVDDERRAMTAAASEKKPRKRRARAEMERATALGSCLTAEEVKEFVAGLPSPAIAPGRAEQVNHGGGLTIAGGRAPSSSPVLCPKCGKGMDNVQGTSMWECVCGATYRKLRR